MWLGLSYCSQEGNLIVESYGIDCNYDHIWHKNGQHCVVSYHCVSIILKFSFIESLFC